MRIPVGVEATKGNVKPAYSSGIIIKSYIMTVSAVCRLRPRPPALVDKMKTINSEFGALNCWTWPARSSVFVPPSNRRYLKPIIFKKSSMMSMTFVIWKKIKTLWPVAKNFGRMRDKSSTFPDVRTRVSLMWPVGFILSSTLSNKKGCWQIFRNCINSLLRPLMPPGFLKLQSASEKYKGKEPRYTPSLIPSIRDHLVLLHLLVQLRLQRAHPDLDHLLHFVW